MIRVHHKIISKENNSRIKDRYTIFNNCIFRKKIKYLFIGLNPSANNNQFTDKTNLWIINWIIQNDTSGGYYLTNLYKNISSTFKPSGKIQNDRLNSIIKKHSNLNICVFYGAVGSKGKSIPLNEESKTIFKKALKKKRLFRTDDDGVFHHISTASKKLKIVECNDLSVIGINDQE